MIFSLYLNGLSERRNINAAKYEMNADGSVVFDCNRRPKYLPAVYQNDWLNLKELLEKSSHMFMCILTNEQYTQRDLMRKYDLDKFRMLTLPNKLTNWNTPEYKRRLEFFVLKGTGDSNAW